MTYGVYTMCLPHLSSCMCHIYTHMVMSIHIWGMHHITYGVYTMCLHDIYHVCIHMICMCHVYTHMVMMSCKNVDVWCLCPVDVSCREYGVFVMQMVHTHMVMVHTHMVMVHTPYVYSTCMQHTFTWHIHHTLYVTCLHDTYSKHLHDVFMWHMQHTSPLIFTTHINVM